MAGIVTGACVACITIDQFRTKPVALQDKSQTILRPTSYHAAGLAADTEPPAQAFDEVYEQVDTIETTPPNAPKPFNKAQTRDNLAIIWELSWKKMADPNTAIEDYLYHWRTTVKSQAALEKLENSDFMYMQANEFALLTESADITYLAASDGTGLAVFTFKRDTAPRVFEVIDECAKTQQDLWIEAAEQFNKLPLEERRRRFEANARSRRTIRSIMRAPLSERNLEQVANLRAELLPPFFKVTKGDYRAWALRSVGR